LGFKWWFWEEISGGICYVKSNRYDVWSHPQSSNLGVVYFCTGYAVSDKHCLTAHELFDENDLAIFSSYLHQEVTNLKAMLHAIDIGTPIFCFSLLFCTCTYASCYRHYYLYKESFIMDDN
jgi:hypothetical protein